MEDLTKQQLVLVALLVSFVTSIATGIVTVTLVNQAPQGVTQTIQRVVEQTVSAVTPDTDTDGKTAAVSSAPVVQKVVTENDLMTSAVAKNDKSLVRISGAVSSDQQTYRGLGIVITKDGMIVASQSIVGEDMNYQAQFSDGTILPIILVAHNAETSTAYFKVDLTASTLTPPPVFTPVHFGDSDAVKIGQGAIVLGGQTRDIISRGTVTSLVTKNDSLSIIQTDAALDSYGAPLIDFQGNVIGVGTDTNGTVPGSTFFLPSDIVSSQLATVLQSLVVATSTPAVTATSTPSSNVGTN